MSRSALWRQEGNVKERNRQADELFQLAVEEGRNNRAKNLVPLWGPDDSFHFNPMLLQNIIKSSYFQKCCRDLTDWNTLVDEIYYQVTHLEPWAIGASKEPSIAFCLLLRLLTLRCTEKQMQLLLDHVDSPYIRCIGFLYLRYAGDPAVVFRWIEPYLYDQEPVKIDAKSAKQQSTETTVGDFVRQIFTERSYYGTVLPRLPIQMEREIQVKLLQAEKTEERAKKHAANPRDLAYFQRVGAKVMALYGDEENPVQWYEGVVDRVITVDAETTHPMRHPRFVVTFPEYGNTETVSLGELEMIGSTRALSNPPHRLPEPERESNRAYDDRSRRDNRGRGYPDHTRGYGGNSRTDRDTLSRGNSERGYGSGGDSWGRHREDRWKHRPGVGRAEREDSDLYEEVRQRERESVTSNSRNAVARRPASTKTSLLGSSHGGYHRDKSPERGRKATNAPAQDPPSTALPAKKRSAEELAAIQAKKRKIMARYG